MESQVHKTFLELHRKTALLHSLTTKADGDRWLGWSNPGLQKPWDPKLFNIHFKVNIFTVAAKLKVLAHSLIKSEYTPDRASTGVKLYQNSWMELY